MVRRNITISNSLEEIPKVLDFIESVGEELNLAHPIIMNVCLAVEEAVANIIMYAYPPPEKDEIHLSCTKEDNELIFLLSDNGVPFDPTLISNPDISLPACERPVGGLGILLIRKIMNEIIYERIGTENRLILKKKI